MLHKRVPVIVLTPIRVMRRYLLTGTSGYGIVYRRNTDNMTIPYKLIATSPELNLVPQSNILYLYAHVDADHGRDIHTRHTVTAYVLPCWFPFMLEVQT